MAFLQEQQITCPYCGEAIVIVIDPSDNDQEYIEDCQVCCRPIIFSVMESIDGNLCVDVRSENE